MYDLHNIYAFSQLTDHYSGISKPMFYNHLIIDPLNFLAFYMNSLYKTQRSQIFSHYFI